MTIAELGAPSSSVPATRMQMVTVMGLRGDVRWVSPSITQLLGWPTGSLAVGAAFGFVHPDDHAVLLQAVMAARDGSPCAVEHRVRGADGSFVSVWSSIQRMRLGDEDLLLLVTDGANSDTATATQAARYQLLVKQSREAIIVHVDGFIVGASAAGGALIGQPVSALIGKEIYGFVAPESEARARDRRKSVEAGGWPASEHLRVRTGDGGTIEVEIASCPVMWDGQVASQITLRPIADVITEAVRLGADAVAGSDHAVIVTDPAGRIVNWNEAAAALYGWSKLEAVGRLVDELLPWVGSDEARRVAHDELTVDGMWHGVAHQLARDGRVIGVRATTRLVRGADGAPTALVSVNEPLLDEIDDDPMLTDLAAGLLRGELEVWYQPIVRLATGAVVKVEALVRWRHPEQGLLQPAAFLPVVERSALIVDLDHQVLDTACHQAAAWRAGPAPDLELAVNLSARDLTDEDLVARVAATLAASGLPPHALWLEVTETALARDAEVAVKTLERLRGLGVRLALDDFGTGFAHLVQLRRFPVQAVKIDRSFVSGMSSDASDAAIVRSVISLGRELGLTIVAEGVETEAERARLVDLGCDLAQGFLFGRPQPADKVQLTAQPLLHAATRTDTDALGLRGIGAETALDAVASLAASLCEAPIALVCLFDGDGQRVKARVGVATDEQIRAHAGVPLVLSDGHTAGTLCVLDTRSRAFTTSQLDDLEAIGAQLVAQLDLQRDLKQARGEAQDRERRLDAVVAGSPNIICSITPEGIVDSLSGTTENLGIDPASYIGRSAMDIIHPDDLATALEELALAAKSLGVDRWLELRLRHASGDWVPFRVTSRTVEVHDGRRLIVLTATKLTGR